MSTVTVDPNLRISELLTARLCHELVGPITAVTNGTDLLCEPDVDVDQEAVALIGESAGRASCRLQFYRFAYGFGGEGQAAGPPPFELAAGYFEASRVVCYYGEAVRSLPLIQQRLGCNLLVFGAEALARGGRLALDLAGSKLRLEAAGEGVCAAREQFEALALTTPIAELTIRTVQGYFTGLLARVQGWRLAIAVREPGRLCITSMASAR